ncbi:LOW QUALITY PROTEIN: Aldose_epim domain-containing protein, partial [Cephalotus follicularis]
ESQEKPMDEHKKAALFELNNGTIRAYITNYGATITSLFVPDKNGNVADIVLGFDSIESYVEHNAPYFGCIVGRVAKRIKDGNFTLNGVNSLPVNNGPNSLHGGIKGFDKVLWQVVECKDGDLPSITFKYLSHDGEEGLIFLAFVTLFIFSHFHNKINKMAQMFLRTGYPGDVTVIAKYMLTSSNTLRLDMEAVPKDKATPVNLAQHTYWNLAGHNSGNVLEHLVEIFGSQITPVDENTIPTGEFLPIKGTVFDFTSEKKIGSSIHEVPGLGYDHNYVLDCGEQKSGLKHAAKVKDPYSSRVLNLWTDAPGMQFYTANYVNGVSGKSGAVYEKHSGLCLETQGFPNAINQPNFPSIVVQPGETYKHTMLFEFSAE